MIKRMLTVVLALALLTASMAFAQEEDRNMQVKITVGEQVFSTRLENNETARAFYELLPMTLDMTELNGNEKYHYLMNDLPHDPRQVNTIRAGDLMLFGGSCVVLFYESFSTGYAYTPLGKLEEAEGLRQALGRGDIQVTFETMPEE